MSNLALGIALGSAMNSNSYVSYSGGTWGNYICRGGEYEGFSVDPMFWDKFALVAGIERDDIQQNSFFTCSC